MPRKATICAHGVQPKSACGYCHADYMREWCKKNSARAKEISKASRDRHREQRREDRRQHYRRNKGPYIARAKKWKAAHREEVREGSRKSTREMREREPRKLSCHNLNNRAQGRGSSGRITLEEYDAVVLASGGHCFWCDGQLTVWCEFDHPMPCHLEGDNSVRNLVLACRSCNKRKAGQHPADFNRERWERFQMERATL